MKGSIMQSADFGRTICRLMSMLVLAGIIGGAAIGPALADERDQGRNGERDQRDQRDQPRHDQGEQRGERAAPHDQRDVRAPIRRDRRAAYGYDVPTYGEVPPPIVYAPPEPPAGISLFFSFR